MLRTHSLWENLDRPGKSRQMEFENWDETEWSFTLSWLPWQKQAAQ